MSPATAERVRSAIDGLGFRVNYGASNLKRGVSTSTIGLVIEDVANPFFSVIARAVEEVARERGHLLVTASSDEDAAREREVIDLLCSRRIVGLLVVPAGTDHRYLSRRSGWERRSSSSIGRRAAEVDTVLLDNVGGARLATEHLLAGGHRRIGVLLERQDVYTAGPRLEGYRQALREAGLEIDEALLRFDCHDAERAACGRRRAPRPGRSAHWHPRDEQPDERRRSQGPRTCRGRRGHGSVALVGFDDFELADVLTPPVSVVAYDLPGLGRRAAEILFDRLAGDARPARRVVMPTWIVARGSGEVRASGIRAGCGRSGMNGSTRVASAGEAIVDLFPSVDDDDDQVLRVLPGGSSLNVAIAMARLGLQVSFAGRISTDTFGRVFSGRWTGRASTRATSSAARSRPRLPSSGATETRSRTTFAGAAQRIEPTTPWPAGGSTSSTRCISVPWLWGSTPWAGGFSSSWRRCMDGSS